MLALIEREADNARRGQPAWVIGKMNALVDPEVIRARYRASQAGVLVDLLGEHRWCSRIRRR